MMKILIGSSVQQKKDILEEFLVSLKELIVNDMEISYIFVDDNTNKESKKILNEFINKNNNAVLVYSKEEISEYKCDSYTHYWKIENIKKVTNNKNNIISYFLNGEYNYLFLIDSDIVLHPKTLQRLISREKDIISNIFWTKWSPDGELMPQVWQYDNYSFYKSNGLEEITKFQGEEKKQEFFNMLNIPGTYPVGGLGACTLISRNALEKGVNFTPLYNISYWGEDRHFCIRAAALGIQLYVDTYYPAYHIYRDEYIEGVKNYKYLNNFRDYEIIKIQLSELVKVAVESFESIEGDDNNKWQLFFSKNIHNCLDKIRKEFINDSDIIKTCKVYDYKMKFDNSLSKYYGKVYFIEYGFKNEESFYNEWEADVIVEKQRLGVWRISSYKKGKNLDIVDKPLIRTVKNKNKLTLSMVVKNEENRYLKRVLQSAKEYIDEAVIIDDGSTDRTVDIIKETLRDIKVTIIQNTESVFSTEWKLRRQQWEETIKTNPDWILFLDADEIFEDKFNVEVRALLADKSVDVYSFRLYDMWSEDKYREDRYWNAHKSFRPFLIRYQKNFQYKFNERNQHCGRMPENVTELPQKISNLRLKHYGWSKKEDRVFKYERYKILDPEGKHGIKEQYESILDKEPKLSIWIE